MGVLIFKDLISQHRVEKLLRLLSSLTMKDIEKIEREDEQFKAISSLTKVWGWRSMPIVIGNALISYQLSSKGEEYWWEFSEFFSRKMPSWNNLKIFLKSSEGNKRLREIKDRRIDKTKKILEGIKLEDASFKDLWRSLGKEFGLEKKTTVFAVKMFGYGKRAITNKFEAFPMEIPIPTDSRVMKFTERIAGLKKEKDVRRFWKTVAERVNIPPLHIDSIIWTRALTNHFPLFKS